MATKVEKLRQEFCEKIEAMGIKKDTYGRYRFEGKNALDDPAIFRIKLQKISWRFEVKGKLTGQWVKLMAGYYTDGLPLKLQGSIQRKLNQF